MTIQYQPEHIQDIVKKYGLKRVPIHETISEEDGLKFESIIKEYIKMGFDVKEFSVEILKEETLSLVKALVEDKVINVEKYARLGCSDKQYGLYNLLIQLFIQSKLKVYSVSNNGSTDWRLVTKTILENNLSLTTSEKDAVEILRREIGISFIHLANREDELEGIDIKTAEVIFSVFLKDKTIISESRDEGQALRKVYKEFKRSNEKSLEKIKNMNEFQKDFLIANNKATSISGLDYFSEKLLNKKIHSFQEFVLTFLSKDKQIEPCYNSLDEQKNNRDFLLNFYNIKNSESMRARRSEEEKKSFQKWNSLLDAERINLHGSKPPNTIYFNSGGFQKMFPEVSYLGNIKKIPKEFYKILNSNIDIFFELLNLKENSLETANLHEDEAYRKINSWCKKNEEIINLILNNSAVSFKISATKILRVEILNQLFRFLKFHNIKLKGFTITDEINYWETSYVKKVTNFATRLDKNKEYTWKEIEKFYEQLYKASQGEIKEKEITFNSNIFD